MQNVVFEEGEYETIDSPETISNILSHLRDKRIYLYLSQKEYESGATVLVGVSSNFIDIDKPLDWPEQKRLPVRVHFKDGTNIRSHFTANVKAINENMLTMTMPSEIFRQQRRANFRIDMPHGSIISFNRKDENYEFAVVEDLGAGGVRVRIESVDRLVEGDDDAITDIVVTIPPRTSTNSNTGQTPPHVLSLSHGKIVREIIDENKTNTLGIQFLLSSIEEKLVLGFVRRMEFEILRSGSRIG